MKIEELVVKWREEPILLVKVIRNWLIVTANKGLSLITRDVP